MNYDSLNELQLNDSLELNGSLVFTQQSPNATLRELNVALRSANDGHLIFTLFARPLSHTMLRPFVPTR